MSFVDFLPHNLHYRVTVLVVTHLVSRIVLSDFVLNASCKVSNSDIGWDAAAPGCVQKPSPPLSSSSTCRVSVLSQVLSPFPFLKLEIRSAKYDIPLGRCATAKTHRCCNRVCLSPSLLPLPPVRDASDPQVGDSSCIPDS